MEKYDLIVIGSGPAGYAAAMRAFDFNKHVCIIEAGHLGGAGIINGALTSKNLWELSNLYSIAGMTDKGYRASGLSLDFGTVKKIVINTAKTKQYQILSQIETFSKERTVKRSLTLKYGQAKFIDNKTVEIREKDTGYKISAENFIIATGSKPKKYPDIAIDQKKIFNSDGLMNLTSFPENMIIIGSGIIGCEFATIFSNFRQTQIHLLDRYHKVIPFEDDDVSSFISNNLEENGVIIHHTANLRTIRESNDHLEAILDYSDGHSKVIEVDSALISIGREPNFEGLCLENVGINPDKNGYLEIDEYCMVKNSNNITNIYAAGDVTEHPKLYNVAEYQGRFAAEGIYKNIAYPANYSSMSTLMFFKPLLAAVGMNEKELQEKKIPYKTAWYSMALVNRAMAKQDTNGFVKIIVSNDSQNTILGMRAGGPHASALIVTIAHLINQKKSLEEAVRVIHPHPSVTEGIKECFRVLLSVSIYKPEAFPGHIRINTWEPEE